MIEPAALPVTAKVCAGMPSPGKSQAQARPNSKPDWAPLPEGVPQFEAYYSQADLLPAERFARMKALIEQ